MQKSKEVKALELRVASLESLLLMSLMGDKTTAFIQQKLRDTMDYLVEPEIITEFEIALENAKTAKMVKRKVAEKKKSELVKRDERTEKIQAKINRREEVLIEKHNQRAARASKTKK